MPSSNRAESSLRLFKTSLRWFSVRQALRKLDNWNLPLALAGQEKRQIFFSYVRTFFFKAGLELFDWWRSNTPPPRIGHVKGTITNALRYHFASNVVRRHRLISVSYISLLPCHGRGLWPRKGKA
jgi:hypothetical protein